MFIKLHV